MSNTIKNSQVVSDTALDIMVSALTVVPEVTRNIGEVSNDTAKFGTYVDKKKPAIAKATNSRTFSAQDYVEDTVRITYDIVYNSGPQFDVTELAMNLPALTDALKPYSSALASANETEFCTRYLGLNGDVIIGSGTSNVSQWKDYMKASASLTLNCADQMDRVVILDPAMKTEALDQMLQNRTEDRSALAGIFKNGMLSQAAGFRWKESNRLPIITTPADIVGAVATNYVQGATSLVCSGFGASQDWQAGTPITVAGCYEILPDTKKNSGKLKQIIIKEDVSSDGSGAVTFTIDPLYISTDPGNRENISALPVATNAVTTPTGIVASTSYRQSVAFQKNAFGFYMASLPAMPGLDGSKSSYEGMELLYSAGTAVSTLQATYRFDTLGAGVCFYPTHTKRIWEPNV